MCVPLLWLVAISPCWGSPTLLSWDQALFSFLTRSLLLNLLPLSLLLQLWSVCCYCCCCCCCCWGFPSALGSSPLLLGCYPSAPCCLFVCLLELTWMLPGSLLNYHEKIHGTVAGAVDVRAFCPSVGTRLKLGQAQGLMLGQMLAQERQGAVLTCWVIT